MNRVQWDDPPTPVTKAEMEQAERNEAILDRVRSTGEAPTLSALLGVDVHAPEEAAYVVEIILRTRSAKSPLIAGLIQLQQRSPNGDVVSIYMCDRCKKPLPHALTQGPQYACPHCRFVDSSERICDKMFFRIPDTKLADLAVDMWRKLECDADIMLRRFRESAWKVVQRGKESKHGTAYEKARRKSLESVERLVYTRDRLMRDNVAGQDLSKQILGFLRA